MSGGHARNRTWPTLRCGSRVREVVLGERFIAAVDAALLRIAAFPGAGSARHAWVSEELPVPLRFVILPVFDRYLIYYLDLPDRVDILRVWDTSRGLDALMEPIP